MYFRLPIEFTEETFDHTRSYKRHALNILVNILPGIDVNDIGKSTLTFQVYNFVALHDKYMLLTITIILLELIMPAWNIH